MRLGRLQQPARGLLRCSVRRLEGDGSRVSVRRPEMFHTVGGPTSGLLYSPAARNTPLCAQNSADVGPLVGVFWVGLDVAMQCGKRKQDAKRRKAREYLLILACGIHRVTALRWANDETRRCASGVRELSRRERNVRHSNLRCSLRQHRGLPKDARVAQSAIRSRRRDEGREVEQTYAGNCNDMRRGFSSPHKMRLATAPQF